MKSFIKTYQSYLALRKLGYRFCWNKISETWSVMANEHYDTPFIRLNYLIID